MLVAIFRNDDLAAPSDVAHERRLAAIFARHRVPQTLGVIPVCATDSYRDPSGQGHAALDQNPAVVEFLKDYVAGSGSEIALHGFYHRTNRLSRPSRREFFEFRAIGLEEQEDRIRRGTQIVERCLGIRPRTFIPPWNRLDANTVIACARNGYDIVSAGPFTEVPAGMFSLGTDCNLESFPGLLAAALGQEHRVFLRIMFHSRTVRSESDIASLERAVALAAQTPGCEALTIAEAVRRYPQDVSRVNEAGRNVVSQDEVPGTSRARSLVYFHAAKRVGRPRALFAAFAAAHTAYRLGRYEEVVRSTEPINRLSRRLLLAGRSTVILAGLGAGALLAWTLARVGAGQSAVVYAAAGAAVIFASSVAWWRGTAPDTKREIRFAACCLVAAGSVGIILGHWMGAGRPERPTASVQALR